MSILHLIASENFITVNRCIAAHVGLEAAVVFGELASEHLYWETRDGLKDGYFFSTVENLAEKTFLSAHSQRQALEKLKELGFIDVVKKGMPAKRFIKINADVVAQYINDKSLKFLTTSDENLSQPVVQDFNTNNNINKKTEEKEKRDIIKKPAKMSLPDVLKQAPIVAENPDLLESLDAFITMRQRMKAPLTERALKMIVNEAYRLAGGDIARMKDIVDQSTMNGWRGVYPLKHQAATNQNSNPFAEILKEEGYE